MACHSRISAIELDGKATIFTPLIQSSYLHELGWYFNYFVCKIFHYSDINGHIRKYLLYQACNFIHPVCCIAHVQLAISCNKEIHLAILTFLFDYVLYIYLVQVRCLGL